MPIGGGVWGRGSNGNANVWDENYIETRDPAEEGKKLCGTIAQE